MVEQLEVGNDLEEVLLQCALVTHYAHNVDALQCHLQTETKER